MNSAEDQHEAYRIIDLICSGHMVAQVMWNNEGRPVSRKFPPDWLLALVVKNGGNYEPVIAIFETDSRPSDEVDKMLLTTICQMGMAMIASLKANLVAVNTAYQDGHVVFAIVKTKPNEHQQSSIVSYRNQSGEADVSRYLHPLLAGSSDQITLGGRPEHKRG